MLLLTLVTPPKISPEIRDESTPNSTVLRLPLTSWGQDGGCNSRRERRDQTNLVETELTDSGTAAREVEDAGSQRRACGF